MNAPAPPAGSEADPATVTADAKAPPSGKSEKTDREQTLVRAKRRKRAHIAIVIAFGALVPVALIALAALGLWHLERDFSPATDNFIQTLTDVQKVVSESKDVNSYALASFMIAEHSNASVVHDKQKMKIVVMSLGFAVLSIGMMFILLGVSDGGVDVKAESAGTKIDLKTASTGLVAFLIGAGMSYGAGIIPNEYSTAGVPSYAGIIAPSDPSLREYLGKVVTACSHDAEKDQGACFVGSLANESAITGGPQKAEEKP